MSGSTRELRCSPSSATGPPHPFPPHTAISALGQTPHAPLFTPRLKFGLDPVGTRLLNCLLFSRKAEGQRHTRQVTRYTRGQAVAAARGASKAKVCPPSHDTSSTMAAPPGRQGSPALSRVPARQPLVVGHPALGTWLPDMQDMGFSEDTIMYRAYYGFKLALPLYPFLTMYQFMQLMQSPAR